MTSSNQFVPFDPSSYLSAQSKVVDDYSMSQIVLQSLTDGDSQGMLVVITGASHVIYGSRGIGIPARISKKIQKKNQAVILLDPERQYIRREGEVPVADFLWYSPAKTCTRNCFDRAEIARVMNAAGRRRDALPQVVSFLNHCLLHSVVLIKSLRSTELEGYPILKSEVNLICMIFFLMFSGDHSRVTYPAGFSSVILRIYYHIFKSFQLVALSLIDLLLRFYHAIYKDAFILVLLVLHYRGLSSKKFLIHLCHMWHLSDFIFSYRFLATLQKSCHYFSMDNPISCVFQDLQKGLDLGLVSPEILQNFFDLEQYPVIAELIHRFQVHTYLLKLHVSLRKATAALLWAWN